MNTMKPDYHEIGQRIACRRKSLGLTQAEVEEMAGLGYKYLSNIERGISIPSVEVVIRLASVLDTTPDSFLLGAVKSDPQECWRPVAQRLRGLSSRQLELAGDIIDLIAQREL